MLGQTISLTHLAIEFTKFLRFPNFKTDADEDAKAISRVHTY